MTTYYGQVTGYTNNPSTTTTSTYGTDAPSSGYSESWVVTSSSAFPAATNAATPTVIFHVADPAKPTELIAVTNVSGTTWTVTRGAENTTPVAHASGATFYQVVSAGDLGAMKQATGAVSEDFSFSNSLTTTVVASYQPISGEIVVGTTYVFNVSGTLSSYTTAYPWAWSVKWGGAGGTIIVSATAGTQGPLILTSIATTPFTVTGSVTFLAVSGGFPTSAVGNILFNYYKSTALTTATTNWGPMVLQNASNTSVTGLSGSGPISITLYFGSTTTTGGTVNAVTSPAPFIYKAC